MIRKIAADDFLSLEYPPAIKRVYHPPVIADSPISTFDYHRAIRDFGTAWWPGTVALAEGLVAFSFSASVLQRRMDSLAKLDEAAGPLPSPASNGQMEILSKKMTKNG